MSQVVHVIGGGAGIGRWLLDRVLVPENCRVYCYDTNSKALESLPAVVVRCPLGPDDDYASYSLQFQTNDWILLVVPLTVFESTLAALHPLIRPGTLIVTLSSIQAEPIDLLAKSLPLGIRFCGCHPLFGPAVSSPVGQLVAITEFDESHQPHCDLRSLLERKGLIVSTLGADEHDRYMAYVQALAHFCLIGFAATLAKDGIPPRDLLKLRTPNFHFLYAFASRVLKLSPTTTGAIQTTPDASKIRYTMLKTLQDLHERFETAGTAAGCARAIEELRTSLSGAEIDEGAEIATMAADSLLDFEETLYRYRNTGSPFVFRHRGTGVLKIVRITDIRHDEIQYIEATKRVEHEGKMYFAVALNDTARANYRSVGQNIRTGIRDSIKKRNIKFLDREDLDGFFRSSILPMVIDHNFVNPHGLDESYFEEWLPLVVKGLWACDFRDAFRQRGGVERITLRLTFNPNVTRETIVAKVRLAVEQRQLTPEPKLQQYPERQGAG